MQIVKTSTATSNTNVLIPTQSIINVNIYNTSYAEPTLFLIPQMPVLHVRYDIMDVDFIIHTYRLNYFL